MRLKREKIGFIVALTCVIGLCRTARAEDEKIQLRAYSLEAAPVTGLGKASVSQSSDATTRGLASKLRSAIDRVREHRPAARRRAAVGSAIAALESRTGSSLDVRIRPSSQTPMWIGGAVLERRGSGSTAALRDYDAARSFLHRNKDLLGIEDPDAELVLERREKDHLGQRHLRFGQRYRGLEVWPSQLIVHLDAGGNVVLVNGAYVQTPVGLDVRPVISAQEAVTVGRHNVPGGFGAEATAPELIVHAPLDGPSRLAWTFELRFSVLSRWRLMVDAHDGTVLESFNEVMHNNRTGSGRDVFGTTRSLNVWEEGGMFFLVDTSKQMFDRSSDPPQPDSTRGGIIILDARNQPPTDDPQEIPNLFLITSNQATGPWLPDGVSAAFGISQTYDYYLERHGRNSIDGRGGNLVGIVRYGRNLFNAFWTNGLMLFGDAVPFTGSIDVIGHEMTHGVTERTADLVYLDQPGALNEAMSDIFGENVEFRTLGGPDWLKGAQILERPIQNYADCRSVEYGPGIPHPQRMSEFIRTSQDNGGVHGNSCIVNHAYYLLADGFPNAIGIRDAERIFYRALTVYLVRNSQFIDARLAAIRAAEDLFGPASVQARRTAEAFDAVEIFDGQATPPPPPFPEVPGPDALLFIYFDPDEEEFFLGRREPGLGDPEEGTQLSGFPVAPTRAAVSGDGEVAIFVDAANDLCLIPTDADFETFEECLGQEGLVHSVGVSPDLSKFGFVLLDARGEPENVITIVDLESETEERIPLGAPLIDGKEIGTVAFAEIMDFTADGRFLIYDAFNVIPIAGGNDLGLWSVYAYDLLLQRTLSVVPPTPGLDIGNPSLSMTSDNFLLLDVFRDGVDSVFAVDLIRGVATEIAVIGDTFGLPVYNGNDSAVMYTVPDEDAFIRGSIVQRAVAADRITPVGQEELVLFDAAAGVVYRRGPFVGPAPTPTPTPVAPRPSPTRTRGTPPPTPTLTACVGDCNDNGEVTVDELIRGVNIALGNVPLGQCPAFDTSGDGNVAVNELVQAVNSALNGCI